MKRISRLLKRFFSLSSEKEEVIGIPFNGIMALGGAGPGRQYRILHGKEAVCISLSEIKMQDHYILDSKVSDNVCSKNYSFCRIWPVRDITYWNAIGYKDKFYAFDIQEVVIKMDIHMEDYTEELAMRTSLYRHDWLLDFMDKMQESKYIIDIDRSIEMATPEQDRLLKRKEPVGIFDRLLTEELLEAMIWIKNGNKDASWHWEDPSKEVPALDGSYYFFLSKYRLPEERTEENIIRFCGQEVFDLRNGLKDDNVQSRQNHCAALYAHIKGRIEADRENKL